MDENKKFNDLPSDSQKRSCSFLSLRNDLKLVTRASLPPMNEIVGVAESHPSEYCLGGEFVNSSLCNDGGIGKNAVGFVIKVSKNKTKKLFIFDETKSF